MENEVTLTVGELAGKLGTDYQVTLGLLTFLISKGIVKKLNEKRPHTGGRGKPSSLYVVPKGTVFFDLVPKEKEIKCDTIANV